MKNEMIIRAIDALNEARQLPWFSSVGEPAEFSHCIRVNSWQEAIDGATKEHYFQIRERASQRFFSVLTLREPGMTAYWGDVQETVMTECDQIVRDLIKMIPGNARYDEDRLFSSLHYDLLTVALEEACEPAMPDYGLARATFYYYSGGYYPCGWQGGADSSGTRIVF